MQAWQPPQAPAGRDGRQETEPEAADTGYMLQSGIDQLKNRVLYNANQLNCKYTAYT